MATFTIRLGQWAKDLKAACVDIEKAFEALTQAVEKFNDNSPAVKLQVGVTLKHIDWPENSCTRETMGCIGWDRIEGKNIDGKGGGN